MNFIKKNYKTILMGIMVILAIMCEIIVVNENGFTGLDGLILIFLCFYLGVLSIVMEVDYRSFIRFEVRKKRIKYYLGQQYEPCHREIALESLLIAMLEIYSMENEKSDFIEYVLKKANTIENVDIDYIVDIDKKSITLKED